MESLRARVVVLIPAYRPDATLLALVDDILSMRELVNANLSLVVVNDGSPSDADPLFAELAAISGITVLRHAVNLGKGAALKTGFNHALVAFKADLCGIVTADADGQHMPVDIVAVSNVLIENLSSLILGVRSFGDNTPFRSKIGNGITGVVFRLFTGRILKDTQTGLRGLPSDLIKRALKISTQGYDFELEMLIRESERGTPYRTNTDSDCL